MVVCCCVVSVVSTVGEGVSCFKLVVKVVTWSVLGCVLICCVVVVVKSWPVVLLYCSVVSVV